MNEIDPGLWAAHGPVGWCRAMERPMMDFVESVDYGSR
jgi:hypothetical protein